MKQTLQNTPYWHGFCLELLWEAGASLNFIWEAIENRCRLLTHADAQHGVVLNLLSTSHHHNCPCQVCLNSRFTREKTWNFPNALSRSSKPLVPGRVEPAPRPRLLLPPSWPLAEKMETSVQEIIQCCASKRSWCHKVMATGSARFSFKGCYRSMSSGLWGCVECLV